MQAGSSQSGQVGMLSQFAGSRSGRFLSNLVRRIMMVFVQSHSKQWKLANGQFLVRGIFAIACLICAVQRGHAQKNWPAFRGAEGDGVAVTAKLPDVIDDSVVVWKTPLPGKAWSSPVVWDDHVWVTNATEDGTRMSAVCVDVATGRIVHDITLLENESPGHCHPMNSYATPTPVVSGSLVLAHFGTYGTFGLDRRSGEVIWSRTDLHCDHIQGPASSPILFDGKLFVAFDGGDAQYVVALDAETGDTIWRKDREIDYGTDVVGRKKAYGTGRVIDVNGQRQLIYPSAVATIAYDPTNGTELWRVIHEGMNVSARPLLSSGGLVVIFNGAGRMIAVRPDGQGDVTATHLAWSTKKGVPHKASSTIVNDLIYMANEKGILSCIDAETGDTVWQERLGGSFIASPVAVDGKIYFFDNAQNIHVIRTGRTFSPVSQSRLDDGLMASPAVTEDGLFLRSRSNLFRIAAP